MSGFPGSVHCTPSRYPGAATIAGAGDHTVLFIPGFFIAGFFVLGFFISARFHLCPPRHKFTAVVSTDESQQGTAATAIRPLQSGVDFSRHGAWWIERSGGLPSRRGVSIIAPNFFPPFLPQFPTIRFR
jgi:hypothetical protein